MSITFGDASAPSDITIYLDAVFAQSLANYRRSLADNIGAANAFLHKLMKSSMYEAYDGGTDIREPLLYALAPMDWYDGYDELPDSPTDGVTQAVFEARQGASPISYSMKEVIQNRQQLVSLVKTKIMQTEMGIQEGFAQSLLWGAGNGALTTARTGSSGAAAIEPLFSLISYDVTTSRTIGNINQSTSSWWRNVTKTSAATTYDGLLFEAMNLYNTCSLGTGGPPDLALCDQTTYELLSFALYQRYRQTSSDTTFPFTNIRLPFGNGGTLLVMDDKIPNVSGNLVSASAKGTLCYMNTKFMKLRYISDRDFVLLKDENGKSFAKPIKGDSRLGHVGWMGSTTINNRRKHGLMGNIARTLTVS